jgi:drug/metabolite transporter (DMT)-like permease
MAPADWLMLGLLSMLWGGSFLFIAVAVAEVPPVTLVMVRTAIGALILLAVARAGGHRLPRDGASWAGFFLLGFFANLLPFSLIAFGQTVVPAGLASILNATTPLFTVLVLFAVRGERIGWLKGVGLGLGVAGVALLLAPKLGTGQEARLIGALAILGGSLSYGIGGMVATRFRQLPPAVTSSASLGAAAMMAAPVSLWFDRPWILDPSLPAIGAVLALGIVSTGLAYLLFYRILNRAGPTNATTVTFLVPVSAILLGALVLGERLDWTAFAGMAVIFTGLAALDGRPVRYLLGKKAGMAGRD